MCSSEAEAGLDFARQARFGLSSTGSPGSSSSSERSRPDPIFGSFNDAEFEEARFERIWRRIRVWRSPPAGTGSASCRRASFAGDLRPPLRRQAKAGTPPLDVAGCLRATGVSFLRRTGPAPRFAIWPPLPSRTATGEALRRSPSAAGRPGARKLPRQFRAPLELIGAEIARLDRDDLAAMRLAIRPRPRPAPATLSITRRMANEFAARFYACTDSRRSRQAYLRDARYGYPLWGADAKVRQLDELYPQLRWRRAARSDRTIGLRSNISTSRPCQGVRKPSRGDRPRKTARHAYAHRDRACGRPSGCPPPASGRAPPWPRRGSTETRSR